MKQNRDVVKDYFLCTWNGDEIIELHTKESLWKNYKDTNLFEDDDWFYERENLENVSLTDLMSICAYHKDKTIHYNDNMTIMYVGSKKRLALFRGYRDSKLEHLKFK
tara:strand:- start:913 stop:1233 length:321 start_codon:yes stop_codon:yes gene_type:complete